MYKQKVHLQCLTPTKNEDWIVGSFVDAAVSWADEIIVADQESTDKTPHLLANRAKVSLILNECKEFDEGFRQRLLLQHARMSELSGDKQRVVFALDADEALSSNHPTSDEFHEALLKPPGTVLRFRWINLLPGLKRCWIPHEPVPFAFIDDRSAHTGEKIHSRRVPMRHDSTVHDVREVGVLHFQYVNWDRMRSKQRWYQIWELIHNSGKRPVQIFRQYNHMFGWPDDEIHDVDPNWIASYPYDSLLSSFEGNQPTWWDIEILGFFKKYGTRKFRKLDVWDVDWARVAHRANYDICPSDLMDPRTNFEKAFHSWLRKSQVHASQFRTRLVQRVFRILGW